MISSLADTLRETAALLDTYPSSTDALRALQGVVNSVTAAQAALVGEMSERGDHEAEGCSSVKNWLRSQLHVDSAEAHSLIHASRTLTALPRVAGAADAGRISLTHVKSFTYVLKHVGPDVVAATEGVLLEVATHAEPGALKNITRELRDTLYPDELDEAWLNGMDKYDIRLSAVGEGFSIAATPLLRWLHSSPGSCPLTPARSSRPCWSRCRRRRARRTTDRSPSGGSRRSTSWSRRSSRVVSRRTRESDPTPPSPST